MTPTTKMAIGLVAIILITQVIMITWANIQHRNAQIVAESAAREVELVRQENRILVQDNLDRIEVRLERIEAQLKNAR